MQVYAMDTPLRERRNQGKRPGRLAVLNALIPVSTQVAVMNSKAELVIKFAKGMS